MKQRVLQKRLRERGGRATR